MTKVLVACEVKTSGRAEDSQAEEGESRESETVKVCSATEDDRQFFCVPFEEIGQLGEIVEFVGIEDVGEFWEFAVK